MTPISRAELAQRDALLRAAKTYGDLRATSEALTVQPKEFFASKTYGDLRNAENSLLNAAIKYAKIAGK